MQKRKKVRINALTDFIQNNDLVYSKIGQEITKNIRKLGKNYSPWYRYDDLDAERRISKLASGTRPSAEEIQALALWIFGDESKWPNLFFPNSNEAYIFIEETFKDEINKVFDRNLDILHQKLNTFTKLNIRNGLNHKRITPTNLTIILLGLLNLRQNDEIRLGYRAKKIDLKQYAESWFKDIRKNSPLVIDLTNQLRDTLDLDHKRKKELKQVVLRGLISAL